MIRKGSRGHYCDCNGVYGCAEESKPCQTRKAAEGAAKRSGWHVSGGVTWCPSCLDAMASDELGALTLGNQGPAAAN